MPLPREKKISGADPRRNGERDWGGGEDMPRFPWYMRQKRFKKGSDMAGDDLVCNNAEALLWDLWWHEISSKKYVDEERRKRGKGPLYI